MVYCVGMTITLTRKATHAPIIEGVYAPVTVGTATVQSTDGHITVVVTIRQNWRGLSVECPRGVTLTDTAKTSILMAYANQA